MERIISLLNGFGIRDIAAVPISACKIINPRRMPREFSPLSAVMFLMPYLCEDREERNISRYAVARDYHIFASTINDKAKELSGCRAAVCADTSPIDEVSAALYAGLGMKGKNGLLVTEKYGTYVFIGAVLTDILCEDKGDMTRPCPECGACLDACPAKNGLPCLSALTQKKGELSPLEEEYIARHGLVWGCDICQDVCPFSIRAREKGVYTDIGFFRRDLLYRLTEKELEGDLSDRAYSWRPISVLSRNIAAVEMHGKA